MKTLIISIVTGFVLLASIKADSYTVAIDGTSYQPDSLQVQQGDTVTIEASGTHPLVQVDSTTWETNGTTPLNTGWGTKNDNYTFTVSSSQTIYYVCDNHVTFGMKGRIFIESTLSGTHPSRVAPENVQIYPNPSSNGIFHLKWHNHSVDADKLIILNGLGKTVKQFRNIHSPTTIHLPKAGQYIVIIKANNKIVYTERMTILNK